MKIFRKNDNWLKYRVEKKIKEEHPNLASKKRFKDRIIEFASGKNSFFLIFPLVGLFFGLAYLFRSVEWFNFFDLKYETAVLLVDSRISDIVTITSLTLVVLGFLISGIAYRDSMAMNVLFQKAHIYPVTYFALSTIFHLFLLSMLRDFFSDTEFSRMVYVRFVVAGTYLSLLLLLSFGYLFYMLPKATGEDFILKQIVDNLKKKLNEHLFKHYKKHYSTQEIIKVLGSSKINFNRTEQHTEKKRNISFEDLSKKVENIALHDINIKSFGNLVNGLKENEKATIAGYYFYLGEPILQKEKCFISFNEQTIGKNEIKLAKKCFRFKKELQNNKSFAEYRDYLVVKVRQAFKQEKHEVIKLILEQVLSVYEYEASIETQNQAAKPKSLFDNLVSDSFNLEISNAIINAIKRENYELLDFLSGFNRDLIYVLLKNKKPNSVVRYVERVYYSYFTFLEIYKPMEGKVNPNYTIYIDQTLSDFGYLISMIDWQKEIDLPVKNKLFQHAANQYSYLLFKVYEYDNLPLFKYIIDGISNSLLHKEFSHKYEERININNLERNIKNLEDEKNWNNTYTQYKQNSAIEDTARRLFLGIKYWILHTYEHGAQDAKYYQAYINCIKTNNIDTWSVLEDLEFFRADECMNGYLRWDEWRLSKSYPVTFDSEIWEVSTWLFKGFIIEQLWRKDFKIDLYNVSSFLIIDSLWVREKLLKACEEIRKNINRWALLIETAEPELETFMKNFKNLWLEAQKHRVLEINKRVLSVTKTDTLKEKIYTRWNIEARIYKILTIYHSSSIVRAGELNIVATQSDNSIDKVQLIDGNYSRDLQFAENFVARNGRNTDSNFFETIKTVIEEVEEISIIKILDTCIEELKKNSIVPNTVLISEADTKWSNELRSNSAFEPRPNPNDYSPSQHYYGKYQGMLIHFTTKISDKNIVVVGDFHKAFKLEIKTNPAWYNEILDIQIIDPSEQIDLQHEDQIEAESQQQNTIENVMPLIKVNVNSYLHYTVNTPTAFVAKRTKYKI